MQYFTIGVVRTRDMLGVNVSAQLRGLDALATQRKLYVCTMTYREPIALTAELARVASDAAAEAVRRSLTQPLLPF